MTEANEALKASHEMLPYRNGMGSENEIENKNNKNIRIGHGQLREVLALLFRDIFHT